MLQQLSFLFVGAVSRNPIYTSFASLIALLVWLNLSAQVILIAGAYIVTGVAEERIACATEGRRRSRSDACAAADLAVMVAASELDAARREEAKERGVPA